MGCLEVYCLLFRLFKTPSQLFVPKDLLLQSSAGTVAVFGSFGGIQAVSVPSCSGCLSWPCVVVQAVSWSSVVVQAVLRPQAVSRSSVVVQAASLGIGLGCLSPSSVVVKAPQLCWGSQSSWSIPQV